MTQKNHIWKKLCYFSLAALFVGSLQVHGESARSHHRLGIYGAVLTDNPFGLIGVGVGINPTDFLRISGGWGFTSYSGNVNGVDATATINAFGGGARLFVPNMNLSPYIGGGLSYNTLGGTGSVSLLSVSFTQSELLGYLSGGFEWQTMYGLNIGLGVHVVPKYVSLIPVVPHLQLGWYF